jgi:hypothetical protein
VRKQLSFLEYFDHSKTKMVGASGLERGLGPLASSLSGTGFQDLPTLKMLK